MVSLIRSSSRLRDKFTALLRTFWQQDRSAERAQIPAELLFRISDLPQLILSLERSYPNAPFIRETAARLTPEQQQDYARSNDQRRRLIELAGTDQAAKKIVRDKVYEEAPARGRSARKGATPAPDPFDMLEGKLKGSNGRHFLGIGSLMGDSDRTLVEKLIKSSSNNTGLTRLARFHDPFIRQAFLERIKLEHETVTRHGADSWHCSGRLSAEVHCALAEHPSEERQIELARCPGLHKEALLYLALNGPVRVRAAVARSLRLSQRDLKEWVAEQGAATSARAAATAEASAKSGGRRANGQRRADRSGVVYLLTNPSMPGLVKIGHSTRNAQARTVELSDATGVPTPFTVVLERKFADSEAAEKLLHAQLRNFRVSDTREFFRCELPTAIEALLALHAEEESKLTERR